MGFGQIVLKNHGVGIKTFVLCPRGPADLLGAGELRNQDRNRLFAEVVGYEVGPCFKSHKVAGEDDRTYKVTGLTVAAERGYKLTADDVRRAVEVLGLDEVHHGIGAAGSKETMRFLADNHIRLNVCPSSNVMLGYAEDYKNHPIRTLVDNGVEVTINTYDLLIFNSSIENEYLLLYKAGTLTADQLEEIRLRGLTGRDRI